MSQAQVNYNANISANGKILVNQKTKINANGITKKSSSYKKIVNITAFIGICMIVLYGYIHIAQKKSYLSTQLTEIKNLKAEKDRLLIELEPIKSTTNIEKEAKVKYNMDYPREDQIKQIDSLK